MKYRLIKTTENDAFMNMALEEAVLEGVANGTSPYTIRFFTWKPKAISIGYFQSLIGEVNLEKCKTEGIDIVRRITGGGTVMHDKEITYSIIASSSEFSSDIIKSYEEICSFIVDALKILGITAEFKPINDILVDGKKISGSAQTRKKGVLLQHGTLIINSSQEEIFSFLEGKKLKNVQKLTKSNKKIITSIYEYNKCSFEEIENALIKSFGSKKELEIGIFSDAEKKRAEELAKTKYSTNEWNYMR